MERIDKQAILHRTHYGLGIYAHILRQCFPADEVALTLSGRDCGLCRNPFAEGARTLHVFIHKTDPTNALSPEYARHTTTDQSIPDGDALDFAQLHYQQSGDELLSTLNHEMHLHIGEENLWYNKKNGRADGAPDTKTTRLIADDSQLTAQCFSFFQAPISNTKPSKVFSLLDAYDYITSDIAKDRTHTLRSLTDTKQSRMYKAANFDYCTFSGTFRTRSDKALIQHSGLLCIDFDHLQHLDALRAQLLQDEYFDTQLLFRSPSGDGLKWIIQIDISQTTHADYFRAVANYLDRTYGVEADKSGKDISRACFLPHDPQCFINPKFLNL